MKKIIIHADASVNGVADLYVDYKAKKIEGEDAGRLLYQTMVKAENSGVFMQKKLHEKAINYEQRTGSIFQL